MYLPSQQPPQLLVTPQVRDHLNVEEVFGICNADEDRGCYHAEEEGLGDPRRREAGGKHSGCLERRLKGMLCVVARTRAALKVELTGS